MKKIEVVAAIIVHQNEILCVQRGTGKFDYISNKYEFPGGKMEEGESREAAIVREIEEELDLKIKVQQPYLTVEHQYPDFFITMHSFICTCEEKHLTLTEHVDFQWLKTTELKSLDWAAADIPIVEKLIVYSYGQ
jgi:8-oxo-dGTP diphosphatase